MYEQDPGWVEKLWSVAAEGIGIVREFLPLAAVSGIEFYFWEAQKAKLVRAPAPGMVLNEHYVGDSDNVCQHACKLGCEGIVSKQLGSRYRIGRSR
jgi:hypothetical protein